MLELRCDGLTAYGEFDAILHAPHDERDVTAEIKGKIEDQLRATLQLSLPYVTVESRPEAEGWIRVKGRWSAHVAGLNLGTIAL